MSQRPEAEISINSQGCWGRENNGMAFLNRIGYRILGSQQLWNRGAENSQPREVSPAKSHLRVQQSWPACLRVNGAEGKGASLGVGS